MTKPTDSTWLLDHSIWAKDHRIQTVGPHTGHVVTDLAFCRDAETANAIVEAIGRYKISAPIKRFPDGRPKPFLPPDRYAELRDDDRFLYNEGPEA